ncbi:hypothetical protein DFQ10_102433 [Winogradskyella eximia]|uniref:Uncharacterized protein n=1 Tax=Winogradskyella eximia TaxID=262006 RepID=A0A3D9H7S9_9FLAO|nr:hypothetical protein [Winogradskyella eximia]RED45557.1 hypothetical protein DFQ10_102433 [Winogradskyella eximia]
MNAELENLQATIKRKYSFKYKPECSESFKTDIKESQIIPLTIEVFKILEWPVVFKDKNSVEAKIKANWNKLTEKITITKKVSGRIEVHSKTVKGGNFTDFGRNSKRTGLFILLFKKLATEYNESGKLVELETELEQQDSWADYEIPTELPKPKEFPKPNVTLSIIGGLIIAILFGYFVAFLSVYFIYIIGIYELCIGIGIGYLFGEVLKKTNYVEFKSIQFMVGGMLIIMFITSQFTAYKWMISENNIPGIGFFEFIKMQLEHGLTLKDLNTGWIGLTLSWLFQIVFPYFLAIAKIAGTTANFIIEKIPEEVLEYTIYLFDMGKLESEVRAELSQKGWKKRSDQDDVFQAIAEISAFQQMNRE